MRHAHRLVLASMAADTRLVGHRDDCLLYTSDAADERSSVDLGGCRIIKKKNREPVIVGIQLAVIAG